MKRIMAIRRENALRDYADAYSDQRSHGHMRSLAHNAASEARKAEDTRQAFLSGLNHELRTPLNHIIGFAELLKNADHYDFDDDKRDEYLDLILKAAATLLDQINAILVSAGYGEPTSERETAPTIVTVLRRLLQEHAANLFVGKVDIADQLPACGLASRDLYKALQLVFSILSEKSAGRRTIGVSIKPLEHSHAGISLTLSVLAGGDGLNSALFSAARAELIRLGGRLDSLGATQAGFQLAITLPTEERKQAA